MLSEKMKTFVSPIFLSMLAALALGGCATQKRDLDFERLNSQWIEQSGGAQSAERELAPGLAAAVDQAIAQWKLSKTKSEREQQAYLVERKIAVFQAGIALARDEARMRQLALEKRDLELAQARQQAEAAQQEADRLRLQNILQQEAAERAAADALAQSEAAAAEQIRQDEALLLAKKEAQLARELAAAQAREAELAQREAALRGDQLEALQRQVAGLREVTTARGKSLVLGDAFFASNQGTLSAAGRDNLQPVLKFLAKYPNLPVTIEGHSDGRGAAAGNLKISQKRAENVRETLIKLGADARRLKTVGLGETQPIATNDTDAGRAKNRRVEVVIEGAK
jgi:OmpA-OmpF porin, OOP family